MPNLRTLKTVFFQEEGVEMRFFQTCDRNIRVNADTACWAVFVQDIYWGDGKLSSRDQGQNQESVQKIGKQSDKGEANSKSPKNKEVRRKTETRGEDKKWKSRRNSESNKT